MEAVARSKQKETVENKFSTVSLLASVRLVALPVYHEPPPPPPPPPPENPLEAADAAAFTIASVLKC